MPITVGPHGDVGLTPVQFQQVTVSSTVLALVIPGGVEPRRLVLGVQAGAIRVRWDGLGDPTTTVGHLLQSSSGAVDMTKMAELVGAVAITRFRMIRDGTTDAVVAYTIEA
jgi:hypothetical protein